MRESDELHDLSTAFTAQHSLTELKVLQGADPHATRLMEAVQADLERLRDI